jgi:hypothetical protein
LRYIRDNEVVRNVMALTLAAVAVCFAATPEVVLNDLDGRAVKPLSSAGVTVLLFTRTDCPISNRYAPEVKRIYETFSPRKVALWLVYVDPKQATPAIREHLKEYGYPFGALLDPRHELTKLAHAEITPEAAVFSNGRLVYAGRIDDRYVTFGQSRQAPTKHDLAEVLEEIASGKQVAFRQTKAVGCFIEDLR